MGGGSPQKCYSLGMTEIFITIKFDVIMGCFHELFSALEIMTWSAERRVPI